MIKRKSIYQQTNAIVLLVAATFSLGHAGRAEAQAGLDKTPASAFAFIAANVGDRSWQGMTETCNQDGCYDNEYRAVTYVTYVGGTYCKIQFSVQSNQGTEKRTVDLSSSLSIDYPPRQRDISFSGPIVRTNGSIATDWSLLPPSFEIGERVFSALNYLKAQCAPKSPW